MSGLASSTTTCEDATDASSWTPGSANGWTNEDGSLVDCNELDKRSDRKACQAFFADPVATVVTCKTKKSSGEPREAVKKYKWWPVIFTIVGFLDFLAAGVTY